MLAIEQKYKDLYNQYGGKSIRLIFFKDNYRALYPSDTLFPSDQLYPAEMDKDSIAFEITDDMVHTDTLTITESLCSEENLVFGSCECAEMEIVVSDTLDVSLMPGFYFNNETGHLFCAQGSSVQVGTENNHVHAIHENHIETFVENAHFIATSISISDIAGLEFMLVESFYDFQLIRGIFTVDSVPKEADRNTRRIIAYDRMKRFDADVAGWYNALKFPMTLKAFRTSLCEFVGVPQYGNVSLVNDDIVVEKTMDVSVLNGRDVIRYICQINGTFGNINANGEFRYVTVPKKGDVSDRIDRYKSVESEEYTVPDIDTVIIRAETNDVGGVSNGDGNNTCIIEGNFLAWGKTTAEMAEMANKIKSVVSNLEYRPAIIEGNAAPWYEMGDRIEVETSDGIVNTIVMYRTSTGINGSMDTLESTGTQELKQEFGIRSEIIQTKGLTAILKKSVEEVSSELKNFEEETSTKFTQTAEKIELEAKRAMEAETQLSSRITLTAQQIELEVKRASAAEGELSSRITINAEQISLKVSKGQVSAQLSVESDKVTISGNRLIVNSTNFQLDGNGNAAFSGTVKGASISGSTISGNTISGGTISGTTISGTTITGGTINGTSIYGGTSIRFQARPGVIQVGDFYVDDEYGRQIFQSYDECTGMSTGDVPSGRWYLWAGYGMATGGGTTFFVDRTRVVVNGTLMVNGVDILSAIKALQSGSGSDGGCSSDYGCSGDCGSDCSGYSSCPYQGCTGLTCGPGDV